MIPKIIHAATDDPLMRSPAESGSLTPPFVAACRRCQGERFSVEPRGELCVEHARESMAAQSRSFVPGDSGQNGADLYAAHLRALGGMRIGA